MSDLPAHHYLGIYRTRLSMAERGVTSPRPDVITGMRRLVAGLSAQDPNAQVRLEIHEDRARFIAAATGELLGEFTITKDAIYALQANPAIALWLQSARLVAAVAELG